MMLRIIKSNIPLTQKNYGINVQDLQLQYYFDVPLAHPQKLEKKHI